MGSGEAGIWEGDRSSAAGDKVQVLSRQSCRQVPAVGNVGLEFGREVKTNPDLGVFQKMLKLCVSVGFPTEVQKEKKTRAET